MIWDGTRWKFDDTLQAFNLARTVCRAAAAECNVKRVAVAVASAKTVAAVERLARGDRRIAATTEQWDADPWLLNTPTEVIDLRTGKKREHRPSDYLTKMTAVAAGGGCPTWHAFLKRVTAGDEDLQHYLQRMGVTAIETDEGRRWAENRIQNSHRRRQDRGPVHATGLFRVHTAIQAADRWQPQAGSALCR
jgi:putative DNA primase/helicase